MHGITKQEQEKDSSLFVQSYSMSGTTSDLSGIHWESAWVSCWLGRPRYKGKRASFWDSGWLDIAACELGGALDVRPPPQAEPGRLQEEICSMKQGKCMKPSMCNSFVIVNSIFRMWQLTTGSSSQQSWVDLEAVQDSKLKNHILRERPWTTVSTRRHWLLLSGSAGFFCQNV